MIVVYRCEGNWTAIMRNLIKKVVILARRSGKSHDWSLREILLPLKMFVSNIPSKYSCYNVF